MISLNLEEHNMLMSTIRRFVDNRLIQISSKIEEDEKFFPDLLREISELGILAPELSEKWGGMDADTVTAIASTEEIAKASAAVACAVTAVRLHSFLLERFGTDQQQNKWINDISTARKFGAFALTEPSAGSDVSSIKTSATWDGTNFIINGSKSFISYAPICDMLFVLAVTTPNKGNRGMSMFIVEREQQGLTIGKPEKTLGLHGVPIACVYFDNCKVQAGNLLGKLNEGFKQAMIAIDGHRIEVASVAVGISQACLDFSIQYAKNRIQFGEPIANFQSTQIKLAQMATDISAARALTYQAAIARDKKQSYSLESAMAKLFAADCAMKHAVEAVQIAGGYGYIKEYPVERYFRDAKLTQIFDGTSDIMKIIIAKHITRD